MQPYSMHGVRRPIVMANPSHLYLAHLIRVCFNIIAGLVCLNIRKHSVWWTGASGCRYNIHFRSYALRESILMVAKHVINKRTNRIFFFYLEARRFRLRNRVPQGLYMEHSMSASQSRVSSKQHSAGRQASSQSDRRKPEEVTSHVLARSESAGATGSSSSVLLEAVAGVVLLLLPPVGVPPPVPLEGVLALTPALSPTPTRTLQGP